MNDPRSFAQFTALSVPFAPAASMPFVLSFETLEISALGASARAVFCTCGGKELKLFEAFSIFCLFYPSATPPTARKLIVIPFILNLFTPDLLSQPHLGSGFNALLMSSFAFKLLCRICLVP